MYNYYSAFICAGYLAQYSIYLANEKSTHFDKSCAGRTSLNAYITVAKALLL